MANYRHAKGPSVGQIAIIILVVLVALSIIGGAAYAIYQFGFADKEEVVETQPTETTPATVEEVPTEPPTEDLDKKYTTMATDYMKNMSLDEKAYQMIISTPEALTGVDVATLAGDATNTALQQYPVGGILYTADNLEDEQQTTELISKTQSFSKTPMFMAIEEDGSETSPFTSKLSTTKIAPVTTATDGAEKKVEDNSTAVAKNMTKFGFNMNLMPNANLEGDKAFANNAPLVAPLVASSVKGYQEGGVVSTLNTFPCISDTDKDATQLSASEFSPFVSGIEQKSGIVMVGDAKVSKIDPDNIAFMSKRIINEMLIKELKFNGVVMTSNLSDTTATGTLTPQQIVTNSINAGVNIFLCPNDIEEYATAIKTAVQSNDVTLEQLDASVTKILALKFKFGIIPEQTGATPSQMATQPATTNPTVAVSQ